MTVEILSQILTAIIPLVSVSWFLSQYIARKIFYLHKDIDDIRDMIKEYKIHNDYSLQKEHERISHLKNNTKRAIECLEQRLNEIEQFLIDSDNNFLRKPITKNNCQVSLTEGDWTEIG